VQSKGVTVKQMYWTLGHYDQVCVFEAPNAETAASVLLSADMLGNIRAQTLRAFTSVEMEKILANIPWPRRVGTFFAKEQDGCFWAVMIAARADRQ